MGPPSKDKWRGASPAVLHYTPIRVPGDEELAGNRQKTVMERLLSNGRSGKAPYGKRFIRADGRQD